MDFAKNILKKYGWEEGKGLGKNSDGIDKPLKPKLKFDKTGLGHDPSEQFTYKWWESAYNSAANNIDVQNDEKNVKFKKRGDIEITTKKKTVWTKHNSDESDTDDETVVEKRSSSTITSPAIVQLSDEQLLRACGGLTGHKAARHGHKLSGKLQRILEQEQSLLSNLSSTKVENISEVKKSKETDGEEKKKIDNTTEINVEMTVEKCKKKSKKRKKILEEEAKAELDDSSEINVDKEEINVIKKKKKSKNGENKTEENESKSKKSSKKKKHK